MLGTRKPQYWHKGEYISLVPRLPPVRAVKKTTSSARAGGGAWERDVTGL